MAATGAQDRPQAGLLKRKFTTDLRTIRESPETIHRVHYFAMPAEEDAPLAVPHLEDALPEEASIVDVVEPILELSLLNQRADKLSRELKLLNEDAEPAESQNQPNFTELMRQYSDFIIIVEGEEEIAPEDGENDEGSSRSSENAILQQQPFGAEEDANCPQSGNASIAENFPIEPSTSSNSSVCEAAECNVTTQPKRKKKDRVPGPQFPDLCLEGETMAKLKSGGAYHYWRMPFRHNLFAEELLHNPCSMGLNPNEDALRFAPSGDIYSYFVRRPPTPARYSTPLSFGLTIALGGPARKLLH